jgi:hypothetical protein
MPGGFDSLRRRSRFRVVVQDRGTAGAFQSAMNIKSRSFAEPASCQKVRAHRLTDVFRYIEQQPYNDDKNRVISLASEGLFHQIDAYP